MLTPEKLADRLTEEGVKTLAFFTALPQEAWTRRLYTDGAEWTVQQVFAHLVQAERSILRLMASILKGAAGSPVDFDLNAYNERKAAEIDALGTDDLAAMFDRSRAETVAWARALRPEDLAAQGRHPYLGIAPLEEMIKLLYRHPQLHQRDIKRMLEE